MTFVTSPSTLQIQDYLDTWTPQSIDNATAFPSFMYTSPFIFELEKQHFFSQSWQFAGFLQQLAKPGDFFTTTVAGQNLVLTLNEQGQVRAFFNVCRHRAAPITPSNAGSCSTFVCKYHAWSYNLDGCLNHAPDMETTKNFDPSQHSLNPVRVEVWQGFIFVNFDSNSVSLTEQLGDVTEHLKSYNFTNLKLVYTESYDIAANWKLYVENSSEAYHTRSVHPGLHIFHSREMEAVNTEALIGDAFYFEYLPFLPNSPEKTEGFAPGLVIESLGERELGGNHFLTLFPNFVLVMCPNFVLARRIDPVGIDNTKAEFFWFVPNTPQALAQSNVQKLFELYDKTVREDADLLPQAQSNYEGNGYIPGRLSVKAEIGVHCFQQHLMKLLCGFKA